MCSATAYRGILGFPVAIGVTTVVGQHRLDVLEANHCGLAFKLSAHGTQKLLTASSSRFAVTAFDFRNNIFAWIVLKKLFVALAQVREGFRGEHFETIEHKWHSSL
jgi:hypothetical protein